MVDFVDVHDSKVVMRHVRQQVRTDNFVIGPHAEKERHEEVPSIRISEMREAIQQGTVLENYPDDTRGPSCLIYGETLNGRPLHIVCTSVKPVVFFITVYEPRYPKWLTPIKRNPDR